MKRLPLGLSDFKEIIEQGYSYVDKTLFIEEIIRSGAKVALIPRPRRFGKTTNLSMLYYFFSNKEKDSEALFRNLKIAKSSWREDKGGKGVQEYRGQFPTIFFTLKEVHHSSWEDAYDKMKICIATEFEKQQFLLEATSIDTETGEEKPVLSDSERTNFLDILRKTASKGIFEKSLFYLILWLQRYYKQKVIVLIDEYDAPIHAGYLYGYYDKIVEFMRGFFGDGLKDNSLLQQAVLTGILRVSKESIFSGFNNGTCYTIIRNDFADKFGLLEEEVESLFREQQVPYKIEEIRKWYNGYLIGSMAIYNPWSIIQCIANQGILQPYWINTSSNELIKKLIWKGNTSFKKDVESLLQGDSITKSIEEGIIFSDLEKRENAVWSLFFFSGYLTLTKDFDLASPMRSVTIPNQEVLSLYRDFAQNWLEGTLPRDDLSEMLRGLTAGNIEVFSELFQKLIVNAMSYHDFDKDGSEKVYHAFVLGLLVTLEKTHEVKSNRESGYGRYDVCLIPRNSKELGVVIEFKKAKKGISLKDTAKEALQQIEEKNYVAELHSRGIAKVLTLGIAFQGKKVFVQEGSRISIII